ncbi:sigma-70 family RNA polymerase sigma factor [Streptomyces sp. HNM0574]|uniref:RNA polymerase sigma factor n=1 Tax=Streptomyces sp. HNM0574 TaxID=2714954 RepID=UPI00146C93CB|nr:sigma-70 family RNA polymerase sigma factor [Streptomyces sp. HNM0574]NLU66836.1 RNA polymerase subunit sigma-24 [Streptomyces sp. HNM0574]
MAADEPEEDGEAAVADAFAPRPARTPLHTTDSPGQAFDLLYARYARSLTRQAFLLSGRRDTAGLAVAYAFHSAWEKWPEVATSPEPAGWVRAAAYSYALSPWHRLHPGRRRPEPYQGPPADRALVEAMTALPRTYRATLLLHDGLGLSVSETAEETEASLPAAEGRLAHAREALAARADELRQVPAALLGERIGRRLRELGAAQPVPVSAAATVRKGSERGTRRRTQAAVALTALVATATTLTALTVDHPTDPPRRPGNGGTFVPGPDGQPLPGPMSAGRAATDGESAYLPMLRSANEHRELAEFTWVDKKEDNLTGPPGQW